MSGVAVVVVSYNTRDLLARCLDSIRGEVATRAYEIVVVDNASEDGSPELVKASYPDVALIRNARNLGFAAAVNQGIRATRAPFVLLVNSDATLAPGAVAAMAAELAAHPRVGAVGGLLLDPDGTFQSSYADFPTLLGETLLLTGLSRWLLPPTFPSHGPLESQARRTVDWVCGALVMLRRAALDEVGLLDERFFMYAEEVDWCTRARRHDWDVSYRPDAVAYHHVGSSYGRSPARRREQVYRSKWLYFRKHRGALCAMTFRALVWAASACKLGAWAASGLLPSPTRRDRARRNVASYRYLLSHF